MGSAPPAVSAGRQPASLVVLDPNGNRTRVPIDAVPFVIGRAPESNLIVRDSRVSRTHARILAESGEYVIEDAGSRHGTFVNGARVTRQALHGSDRIEFGIADSYHLIFSLDGAELKGLIEHVGAAERPASAPHGVGGGLAKLRAILDLARMLQSSFSTDDVLAQVVDTALAITGSERGFLLLRKGHGLEARVARNRQGRTLHESELRVPREVIHRALQQRRELLFMNFDPLGGADARPQNTIADLELRSVICVPLVRIRTAHGDATNVLSTSNETVGALYMDSRVSAADMTGGNRELLQTLAIEASTVLENARLLEEERAKRRMEEELTLARNIQQSLLPREFPSEGWFRAAGSSVASREVGGDYFDVSPVNADCWSVVVADVSGKGVSSALLASLLQGALITASDHAGAIGMRIHRLNRFLLERTAGEKYATIFYALLNRGGRVSYVNAAQCPPIVLRSSGEMTELNATGVPVGLVESAEFIVVEHQLAPGDKIVIYSDGVTEAQNTAGEFFGVKRLKNVVRQNARGTCVQIHDAIQDAVSEFAAGAPQTDDVTVLVLQYSLAAT
jgi:serine phosphatase RsbU (regulator of sigma subunit)